MIRICMSPASFSLLPTSAFCEPRIRMISSGTMNRLASAAMLTRTFTTSCCSPKSVTFCTPSTGTSSVLIRCAQSRISSYVKPGSADRP